MLFGNPPTASTKSCRVKVFASSIFAGIIFLFIQYGLFKIFAPSEMAAGTEWFWLMDVAKEWGWIVDLVGNLCLTGLTLYGLSVGGALRPIQDQIGRIILKAVFVDPASKS